jgi:outer membrane lipoprotein-sorting protein
MKAKKIILIVSAVISLFLLGFLVWKLTNKKAIPDASLSQQQIAQESSKQTDAEVINGNIYDLLKFGKTLKCEYSTDEKGTKISVISYISGKNMRGDLENTDPTGNQFQSHMISDGEWVYTWSSAIKQGIKMKLSNAESKTPAPDAKTQNHDVFKDTADYTCSPWIEDTSLFQVPSDITFTDFSESLKNINSGDKSSMCAACDYAQDESDKTVCKKQLGCQ